jgi:hypothetical protein
MSKIDDFICRVLVWARQNPLLFRFTLGTKILLALGFIPTGAVKAFGLRFASALDTTSGAGAFFEMLYQSGPYWMFLGLAQVLAGILVLSERTAALGAILFFGIISNIFLITISYDFSYTPVITVMMLLASMWLLFWDWHRIRNLFYADPTPHLEVAQPKLSSKFENGVYITGFVAGLLFFSAMRGLLIPGYVIYALLIVCLICFVLALGLGIKAWKVSH